MVSVRDFLRLVVGQFEELLDSLRDEPRLQETKDPYSLFD